MQQKKLNMGRKDYNLIGAFHPIGSLRFDSPGSK